MSPFLVCGVWWHIKKGAGGDLLSRPGGSIIGAGELDFRVRHGNGYFLPAVAAGPVCTGIAPLFPRGGGRGGRGAYTRGFARDGQYGQASRLISTARLSASPRLHLQPIDRMVSPEPSGGQKSPGRSNLEVGFPLRCFQRLSLPDVDTRHLPLAGQPANQRSVRLGPLVLKAAPLRLPTLKTDRDRTVSRRSEPSSRTALIGEQPNPWDLLQPQDAMSRHRGAKLSRRCELLGKISLLSPEYLLSVK